jgi:hypothetical protein
MMTGAWYGEAGTEPGNPRLRLRYALTIKARKSIKMLILESFKNYL